MENAPLRRQTGSEKNCQEGNAGGKNFVIARRMYYRSTGQLNYHSNKKKNDRKELQNVEERKEKKTPPKNERDLRLSRERRGEDCWLFKILFYDFSPSICYQQFDRHVAISTVRFFFLFLHSPYRLSTFRINQDWEGKLILASTFFNRFLSPSCILPKIFTMFPPFLTPP